MQSSGDLKTSNTQEGSATGHSEWEQKLDEISRLIEETFELVLSANNT